jgi:hypothetical protein
MLKCNVNLATDLLLLVHLNSLTFEHTLTCTNEFDGQSVEMKKKIGWMSNYSLLV